MIELSECKSKVVDIPQHQLRRAEAKYGELMLHFADGRLPFVLFDEDNPNVIISAWNVADSGDEIDDTARGCVYADLLVRRAKNWRDRGKLVIDPFQIIHEVLLAIARTGDTGVIARGFLSRISMLALSASLN